MPLRETKDSAEHYEAVLSLKSTGLTYRTKQLSSLCSVCERDIVENALETFVALFALENSFTFFSISVSSSSVRFFQNHNER